MYKAVVFVLAAAALVAFVAFESHVAAISNHAPPATPALARGAAAAAAARGGGVAGARAPRYLTFVPDLGGWNNVRLGLENALVIARSSGRILVLPPPQTYYLLDASERLGLEDLLPALVGSPDRAAVIAAAAFVEGGFGDGFANVGRECLAFGSPPEARLAAACGPRTAVDGTPRARIDGDALFGGPDAVLRVGRRATHHAAAVRANRAAALRGEAVKPIEQNALGRLLAPPCAYVVHGDAATANFCKRLVRDLVRPSERATCAALRVVRWLRGVRKRGGTFSSVHVRSTDFQYAEGRADWAVVSRALAPREPVFVATDDDTGAVAAPLERAGHAVFTLAPLVRAALGGTRPKRATHWPDKKVLDALKAVKRAEVGVVDALIAAEGRTFTGAWFSTFTGFIHRVRGYRGYADNSSFFSAAGRWAAFQGFEAPRTPLYMREWPAAWRNIDSDGDAAPYPGERVFDEIDPAEGYPTDAVPEGLLAPKLEACVLPQSMRYWRAPGSGAADARLLRDPEAVPRLAGDRFLTFVPDLGGWNNVRLSFENVLVLARSTGRTLVLPPPQTYYLLTNCKRNCVFGFDDFLPALLDVDDLVITAAAFFKDALPALHAAGRLRRPARRDDGGSPVAWPPEDARVVDYADGCTPTHLAPGSCFPAYFWLEDAFGLPDHIPDVGQQCVVFGEARARRLRGDGFVDERLDDFCAVRTSIAPGVERSRVDGDALWGDAESAVLHVRSSGVATHEHDKWRDKKVGQGGPQLEPARMGRLLAPWYAYVVHADPAVANFYKRLVRDVVRLDEPRVTCAAAGVVAWLRSAYGGAFASAHARRNEFQFKETNAQLGAVGLRDVLLRVARPGQALFLATDEKNASFFDPVRAAGRPVVLLSELLAYGSSRQDGGRRPDGAPWPPRDLAERLLELNGNELGFVDVLVASQGATFTGSWFSTFTSFIHRLRGYGGFRDADSYFTAPDRWAAFQGFERIRSPLYMREWPMAWRGIDGDEEAAPLPGERVFEPGVAKDGDPTDHLPPAALLAAT
ncbi:hypothetical protein JL721_12313 [Aureococcus anophagefferens]|nr:hypothetical protein JL721_12313 [Aureococcus anophagefferens]